MNSYSERPTKHELESLLSHYQANRYDRAEKLAQSFIKKFPNHQFGWKVLGAIFVDTGRNNQALIANKKSVKIKPYDAEAITNLGVTYQSLGEIIQAQACYKRAISLKPEYFSAHKSLGETLTILGKLNEAEVSYKRAIKLKPDFVEAHYNLGNVAKTLGKLEEAEESYRQAITLKSDFVEAHYNLGILAKTLGKLKQAEESYRQAITLKPDFVEAYFNLGNIYKTLGKLDAAESSFRSAIKYKQNFVEAYNNLGTTLQALERPKEAKDAFMKSIYLDPEYFQAHNNLGNVLQELAKVKEAEESFKKAIKLNPNYSEAHRHLANLKKFKSKDKQFSKMLELYSDNSIAKEELCHINFGLAKAYEDLGDFAQAFKHFSEANKLRKTFLGYDIVKDVKLFNRIESNYPQIKEKYIQIEDNTDKLIPIFIIGMPRSGTTLVEQIISSHSRVTGAGELNFVSNFGKLIASGETEATTNNLHKFRRKYLEKLNERSDGNQFITDKMPQNFLYLGLITAAFPEAKIIHVLRDSAAVCWANYKQYFATSNIGFCYSLDDIIEYYSLYKKLMEFWKIHLGKRIYELDYELLTVNQETESKRVVKQLGLNWELGCLSPQNNRRGVRTASNLQVIEKVYTGSSESWKRYKPFLKGVLDFI